MASTLGVDQYQVSARRQIIKIPAVNCSRTWIKREAIAELLGIAPHEIRQDGSNFVFVRPPDLVIQDLGKGVRSYFRGGCLLFTYFPGRGGHPEHIIFAQ